MISMQEKISCVLWLAEFKSVTAAIRNFKKHYTTKNAPTKRDICDWMRKFQRTGSITRNPGSGRQSSSEENIQAIDEIIKKTPKKSVRKCSLNTGILPKSTVHEILRVDLHKYPYKIQMHQMLLDEDLQRRKLFCREVLQM